MTLPRSPERTALLYWDSTFCLQPGGDTITRKAIIDALLLGKVRRNANLVLLLRASSHVASRARAPGSPPHGRQATGAMRAPWLGVAVGAPGLGAAGGVACHLVGSDGGGLADAPLDLCNGYVTEA